MIVAALAAIVMQVVPDRDLSAPVPQDEVIATQACVDASAAAGVSPAECIGATARTCQALAGGDTTYGMLACLTAETEIWDQLMAAWMLEAKGVLDPAEWNTLQASQEHWTGSVEASLTIYSNREGTMWPVVREAYRMDWTARRALWVYDFTQTN